MLELVIPKTEAYDEATNTFLYCVGGKLTLEHSLISVSKWESKWHKPFLVDGEKPLNEILDYIRCMTINKVEDPNIYEWLPPSTLKEIMDYMANPMTATWFRKNESSVVMASRKSGETVTAELVYYWMISLGIPMETEKWHLNRLMTLIKVFSVKNRKVDPKQAALERMTLNEQRKKKWNTTG